MKKKPNKKPFLDYINGMDKWFDEHMDKYGCGCKKKEGKKLCPQHGRI